METPPDGKSGGFWTFNIGHLAGIVTVLLSVLGSIIAFTVRFEGHEYRIQALERADSVGATLPSRVTVVETMMGVVQAQLTQLNMTSNRTNDSVQAIREDMATLKARGN